MLDEKCKNAQLVNACDMFVLEQTPIDRIGWSVDRPDSIENRLRESKQGS